MTLGRSCGKRGRPRSRPVGRAATQLTAAIAAAVSVSLLVVGCGHPDSVTEGAPYSVAPPGTRRPRETIPHVSIAIDPLDLESTTTFVEGEQPATGVGPVILSFAVTPEVVSCKGSKAQSTMAWEVNPVQVAVNFEVDGKRTGPAGGYANAMAGMPMPAGFPCDGRAHEVTLVATTADMQQVKSSLNVVTVSDAPPESSSQPGPVSAETTATP